MWISPPNSPTFEISNIPDLQISSKIFGGTFAIPGEFPYQLQLLKSPTGAHSCGAVLITTYLALTAAHCVLNKTSSDIKLVGGQHLRQQIDGTEQSRGVREIFAHKNYDRLRKADDIAMLVLDQEFILSDRVKTAVLPSQTTKFRDVALVSGWGIANPTTGSLGAALKKVPVPIVPLEVCRRAYREITIPDTAICAGTTNRDACLGDSGGPLTCIGESGERYLCGIVSWGRGCGQAGYPTVYTKVAMYDAWIQEKISELRVRNLCTTGSNRCTLNFNSSPTQETHDPCSPDEFHCSLSNKCIPLAFHCDKELDCGEGDRSDEFGCPVETDLIEPCNSEQFECERSKRCVPGRFRCDGDNDCQRFHSNDTSDEENCGQATAAPAACDFSQFQCRISQKCIPLRYLCDGDNDCGYGDRSDEANCTTNAFSTTMSTFATAKTTHLPCGMDEFQCRISQRCIPRRYICDGDNDCGYGDRSDEANCATNSFSTLMPTFASIETTHLPCGMDEFQCRISERCIPRRYLCDGDNDCGYGDRSDEVNCTTNAFSTPVPTFASTETTHLPCGMDEFQCRISQRCIPRRYLCDGDNDCGYGDRSDEVNCTTNAFSTPVPTFASTETTHLPCGMDEFQCRISQTCIPRRYICDGDNDCGYGDRSDEANCTSNAFSTTMPTFATANTTPLPCGVGNFQCKINEECIPLLYVCDGDDDCGLGDRSDEENCLNRDEDTSDEAIYLRKRK